MIEEARNHREICWRDGLQAAWCFRKGELSALANLKMTLTGTAEKAEPAGNAERSGGTTDAAPGSTVLKPSVEKGK